MSERLQHPESGSRTKDLAVAVGFIAVAGLLAGASVDFIEQSPEAGPVLGAPALVLAAGMTAIAVSIWNRLTNKEKPS